MDCPTGKAPIDTYARAEMARRRSSKRHEQPMATYRCTYCGQLHLGAPSGMKKPLKTIYSNHRMRLA